MRAHDGRGLARAEELSRRGNGDELRVAPVTALRYRFDVAVRPKYGLTRPTENVPAIVSR
jgi:hypothetical protein